jgi:hypothetical protein
MNSHIVEHELYLSGYTVCKMAQPRTYYVERFMLLLVIVALFAESRVVASPRAPQLRPLVTRLSSSSPFLTW